MSDVGLYYFSCCFWVFIGFDYLFKFWVCVDVGLVLGGVFSLIFGFTIIWFGVFSWCLLDVFVWISFAVFDCWFDLHVGLLFGYFRFWFVVLMVCLWFSFGWLAVCFGLFVYCVLLLCVVGWFVACWLMCLVVLVLLWWLLSGCLVVCGFVWVGFVIWWWLNCVCLVGWFSLLLCVLIWLVVACFLGWLFRWFLVWLWVWVCFDCCDCSLLNVVLVGVLFVGCFAFILMWWCVLIVLFL